MLEDGFILSYRAGAKGDFLMRFLHRMPLSFEENGKTVPTENFTTSMRTFEINCRVEAARIQQSWGSVYNRDFQDWFVKQEYPIVNLAHRLESINEENLAMLKTRCKHIYLLLIEPKYYSEVAVANNIKNMVLLQDEQIEELKAIEPRFNGQFRLDKYFFTGFGIFDWTDEKRIDIIKWDLKTFHGWEERFNRAKNLNANHVSYGGLFKPPYNDLIMLYRELHGIDPDLDEYVKVLEQSNVPNEVVIYNHRIRIDYDSDSIITVLGKVNT